MTDRTDEDLISALKYHPDILGLLDADRMNSQEQYNAINNAKSYEDVLNAVSVVLNKYGIDYSSLDIYCETIGEAAYLLLDIAVLLDRAYKKNSEIAAERAKQYFSQRGN